MAIVILAEMSDVGQGSNAMVEKANAIWIARVPLPIRGEVFKKVLVSVLWASDERGFDTALNALGAGNRIANPNNDQIEQRANRR